MNTSAIILTLECSLLAVFILVATGLMMFNWKNLTLRHNARFNKMGPKRKFMILPQSIAKSFRPNVEQFQITTSDLENNLTADECTMLDETIDTAGASRLYFSLKYEPKGCLLTIKLIKGENLPTLYSDTSKAYVIVQIISNKTDEKTGASVLKKSSNTIYQRTYSFSLQPKELFLHTVHFEISRFDRFSRKYVVGNVDVALSQLQGIDLKRESLFTKDITYTHKNKSESRKRKHSSHTDDRLENSQPIHEVKKDAKVRQKNPQALWNKLSNAVHAGLFEELRRTHRESLQWDPFLIVQRYTEHSDSDTTQRDREGECSPTSSNDSHEESSVNQEESMEQNIPEWISNVFSTVSPECPVNNSSIVDENEPPFSSSLIEKTTSSNQEFYRLVHSPSMTAKTKPIEPLTSWSIPETFRFPPSPVRIQAHTVVFQSASSTKHLRQDRLHKLTSLSSNYRERILRKSRKSGTTGRSRLSGRTAFHESLYLDKETRHMQHCETKRTCKRHASDEQ